MQVLKKEIFITKINDIPVTTGPKCRAMIASYNAGDKVNVTYKRDGKEYTTSVP